MPADSPSTAPADALRAARQRDSLTKRGRVLSTLDTMLKEGEPVTFAAVAKRAEVSTWLTYAPGVRDHNEKARKQQEKEPVRDLDSGRVVSPSSTRTDLLLAREEIRRLREEIHDLREGMRRQLGHKFDHLGGHDLRERLDELTQENHRLAAEAREAPAENRTLTERVQALEVDLAGARTSLRRMMREQN
ncbi:DUF6262 family protein [Streptomyces sp. NPDC056653]|uniref:DUF6262 family protein n=1 Tax=Streptomyces sp. NPDC056653 TaxID=3345894 RepID=UPI0036CBB51D